MPRYTRVAILLHWLIAIVILSNFVFGQIMVDMTLSPTKLRYYSYHKWAGVTVFVLVLLRIVWRLAHRPPDMPRHMSPIARKLAAAAHGVLYLLTLAVPISGWLFSSAKGFQTVYFGVLPIPDLIAKDTALAEVLVEWHENLNAVMMIVVILHVLAALKHHFLDRDDVLARMLPIVKSRSSGVR